MNGIQITSTKYRGVEVKVTRLTWQNFGLSSGTVVYEIEGCPRKFSTIKAVRKHIRESTRQIAGLPGQEANR